MHIRIKLLIMVTCMYIPTLAKADTNGMWYQPAGQISSTQLPIGTWGGRVSFQNVYCATFPKPELAQRVDQAFFNNKTVFWMSVSYVNNTVASIVVSTIPEDQSADYAIDKILLNEKNSESVLSKEGIDYKVEETKTIWGRSVNVKATNLMLMSKSGPFPLARAAMKSTNPNTSIISKSVHRLFVRNHDRFEVAIMQTPIQTTNEDLEKREELELMSMLDQLAIDLQLCTSQMTVK